MRYDSDKPCEKAIGGHVIFDDLSMQIADREFAVLTGPSGCGKTTLLHMIGGIEPVDSGDILVGDFNVANGKISCTITGMKWASCFRILPW